MIIVQAPQTSSRQPLSHTGVVVCRPSVVTGLAAMYCRQEMMFMFGRQGRENSSQRLGLSGPSCRRIRIVIVLEASPFPPAPGDAAVAAAEVAESLTVV